MLFDPHHTEMSMKMVVGIIGIVVSIIGTVATAIIDRLAVVDPMELALQPIHVVLLVFIVIMGGSLAVVIRAVWKEGIDTAKGVTEAIHGMKEAIQELKELHEGRMEKYDELGFHAVQSSALGAPPQPSPYHR